MPSYAIDALREDAIDETKQCFGSGSAVAELISENTKLRELLKYNGAVIEACTREILDHIGVPYIVGPAGVAQALMEATAMLVHKRYGFEPPAFYKEDK